MLWCITKSLFVCRFTVVCLVLLGLQRPVGEEPEIVFDVPALVGVRVVEWTMRPSEFEFAKDNRSCDSSFHGIAIVPIAVACRNFGLMFFGIATSIRFATTVPRHKLSATSRD